jgi:hypothetical protein
VINGTGRLGLVINGTGRLGLVIGSMGGWWGPGMVKARDGEGQGRWGPRLVGGMVGARLVVPRVVGPRDGGDQGWWGPGMVGPRDGGAQGWWCIPSGASSRPLPPATLCRSTRWPRPATSSGTMIGEHEDRGAGLVSEEVGPGVVSEEVGPGVVSEEVGPGLVSEEVGPRVVRFDHVVWTMTCASSSS